MRKNYFGKQLKRDANERKALFRGLLNALVLQERIRTTEAKAKAIKGDADKLVTKAKTKKNDAYQALTRTVNHEAAQKLINDLGPRFQSRAGGYTRITKVGKRIVDNAPMVVLEWTEQASVAVKTDTKTAKRARVKKTEKVASEAKVKKEAAKKAPAKKTETKKAVKKAK